MQSRTIQISRDKILSKSTMMKVLKSKFGLSYKKGSTKDVKATTPINKQKLYRTSIILCRFIDKDTNLVFIDEYTVCTKNLKPYNWAKKSEKAILDKSQDNFKAIIIIAVSRSRIVGIQATTETVTALLFKGFITSLIEELKEIGECTYSDTLPVYDNTPIHTARLVSEYLIAERISMLTLAPYNLWSNPAEFAIR